MKEIERQQLLAGLKALHAQSINLITSIVNGLSKENYSPAEIKKFKKLNNKLDIYIRQIENGADCTKTLREWSEMLDLKNV